VRARARARVRVRVRVRYHLSLQRVDPMPTVVTGRASSSLLGFPDSQSSVSVRVRVRLGLGLGWLPDRSIGLAVPD